MSDLEAIRKVIKEELQPLTNEVATVREVLLGNGDTDKSLVVRVAKLESGRSFWKQSITPLIALGALAVAIFKK